ncbi:type II toxin-antitoxin system HigB family toxin [Pantoea vagans]|uniref:type II toxin-antitoxin system HigB family toxin n=1 Tax=Pantoea vagans TaxID=470934 RepID=UPI002899CDB1|nr:type II toxin-antitoxin system HigB family toxin [Pantoea vagans]
MSRVPFDEAARKHPNAAAALDLLYRHLRQGDFCGPDDLRGLYASLDRMKYRAKWWVIDVSDNPLRVIFFADFERSKIFIKHICTHAEYDKLV